MADVKHELPSVWWDEKRGSLVVADLDRESQAVVIEHWSAADNAPTDSGVCLPELRQVQPPAAVDVDDFIRSALDARHTRWSTGDVLDLAHGTAHWLTTRGVLFSMDGEPFVPGQLSLSSWRRLVRDRGLDADEVDG